MGFLWEPDLSLEFISVQNIALQFAPETTTQTGVSGGLQKDTSHFDHIAEEKVLKRKYDLGVYQPLQFSHFRQGKRYRTEYWIKHSCELDVCYGLRIQICPQDDISPAC